MTGIRQVVVDAVHGAVEFQPQYAGPKGAEYTVGRVLAESLGAITTRTVRKRGLACDWNTTSGNGRSPWSCRIPVAIRRPQRGRVHRRSSPRRVTRRDYHANGAEERTRTSTSLRTHEPESCASANSATSAREERGEIVVALPPVKAGSSRVKQARGSLGLAQHSSGSDRLARQLLSAV